MFIVARGYATPTGENTFRPASNPHVHKSLEIAQQEAERLARETGGKFYIFSALSVSEMQPSPVKTTYL